MIPDPSSLIDTRLLSTLIFSGAIAALVVAAKTWPLKIWIYLKRHLVTFMVVDSTCEAYHLFNYWIEDQKFSKNARSLLLENNSSQSRALTTKAEDALFHDKKASWRISMSEGTYFFWYSGTFFMYQKSKQDQGAMKQVVYQSTVTAFTRNRQKLGEILGYCQSLLNDSSGSTPIYNYSSYWQMVDRRKPRPLSTVYLKKGQLERIILDMQRFYASEDRYSEMGLPYRRGYKFEGPTGTGKTSLIVSLAAFFGKPVYLINLNTLSNDKELMDAITQTPKDCFVLIEDIDCAKATAARKTGKSEGSSDNEPTTEIEGVFGVTLAGLLNALDGITTPEGRLYFMTTNHPEKLDSALVRPGRVDMSEHIGLLGAEEQVLMASKFFPGETFRPLDIELAPSALINAFMKSDSAANAQEFLEKLKA